MSMRGMTMRDMNMRDMNMRDMNMRDMNMPKKGLQNDPEVFLVLFNFICKCIQKINVTSNIWSNQARRMKQLVAYSTQLQDAQHVNASWFILLYLLQVTFRRQDCVYVGRVDVVEPRWEV